MMDPRYNQQQNNNDWMSKLDQIKAARKEFEKLQGIMTPYERQTIYGGMQAEAKANYSRIYNGVKERFEAAKSNYKAAAAKRAAAIAKEINNWDTARLNAEVQAFQTRLSMELGKKDAQGAFTGQPAAKRIAALYQEAQASGDKYKMRAAAEVLQAANFDSIPREQRMDVLMVSRAASDNLEALRNTDEIRKAIEQENAAVKQLQDEQQFLRETGAVMNDDGDVFGRAVGNFAKLASTVKFEREAGSVKIRILDANDPEITGIDWNETTLEQLKKQQEGQQ